MTAGELRAIRSQLGLTQAELGEILGVHGRVVRRWEAEPGTPSSRAIPAPAARLVRLVVEMPKLMAKLIGMSAEG